MRKIKFKVIDGTWSKEIDMESKDYIAIVKHMNWSNLEAVQITEEMSKDQFEYRYRHDK